MKVNNGKAYLRYLLLALVIVMCLSALTGCMEQSETQKQSNTRTKNAETQMAKYPTPLLEDSVDRANIILRLTRGNNPYNLQWIYPMSAGRVLGRFPVMGKITSGTKRLNASSEQRYNNGYYTIEQPDEMGTFGHSSEYVFWFDPSGNGPYQHAGDYFSSPIPLQIDAGFGTIIFEIDLDEQAKVGMYQEQIEESAKNLEREVHTAVEDSAEE